MTSLPVEDLQALHRGILAASCVRSFKRFARTFWPYAEPAKALVWNWHHDLICDRLQRVGDGDLRRLIICMPPGFAKSIFVSVLYVAWRYLRNPAWRVICGSNGQLLAERDSVRTRNVVQSPLYRSLVRLLHEEAEATGGDYPEWEITEDQNTKKLWITTASGMRQSIGRDSDVVGHRSDDIIVDDPLDLNDIDSDAEVAAAGEWVSGTLALRVNDADKASWILVMQRLREDDPAGVLLKQGGWELLSLAMEYDPEDPDIPPEDPRKTAGELLHPARFSAEAVALARLRLGDKADAQLNQRPTPKQGFILDSGWLGRYRRAEVLPTARHLIASVDFNSGRAKANLKTKDPDYFVSQVWASVGPDRYLVEQRRGQIGFNDAKDAIRLQRSLHPRISEVKIEAKVAGPPAVEDLEREMTGVSGLDVKGSKEERAHACSPVMKQGHVFLPVDGGFFRWDGAKWVEDPEGLKTFLDEVKRFPRVRHDDQTDAMTQALLALAMSPDAYQGWLLSGGWRIVKERREAAQAALIGGVVATG